MTPSTPGLTRSRSSELAVHRLDEVELQALGRGVEPGVLDVADLGLGDGLALVADAGPLVDRRQEGAAVVLRAAVVRGRLDRDEAGQVLVLGAEAVERPRPQRGPDELEMPVCSIRYACGWAGRSVCMLRTTHSSSACVATSGNSSETQSPLWPCWRNFHGEPSSFAPGMRPGRSDALPSAEASSACSRRYRRATAPRSCRGRSRAWPGPGSAAPSARAASPSARPGRHRRQAGEREVAEPGGDALQQVATREARSRIHRIGPPPG